MTTATNNNNTAALNTNPLAAGDAIQWETMFGEVMLGIFRMQTGGSASTSWRTSGTVHAVRMDGTPVMLDAIRVHRAEKHRLDAFAACATNFIQKA